MTTEKKELYVKVTIDEKGEITINSSMNVEHALKLLNEGITVCADAIIETKYPKGKLPAEEVEEETIITTEE